MTRTLAALAAAAAVAMALAQAAPAKPGGTGVDAVREANAMASASGNGSTATATAICPRATKVAGGGFDAPYTTAVIGLVYESVKERKRRWRVSVQLLDPGQPSTLTLTAYAYCRPRLPAIKTRRATVPTTGKTQVGPTASARCARGEEALAGGFRMPPPLGDGFVRALPFDSIRPGTAEWDTRVVTGPAGPSSVTSEAYCSRRGTPPIEATAVSPPNHSDFTSSSATAACPAGLSPAAGGFAQPGSGLISFFIAYESRRVGDAWRVSGLHSGSDPAATLSAAAYCA